MSDEIATLLAQKFIARRDVKAIQHADGSWAPHTDDGKRTGARLKWTMGSLREHLSGAQTYGHYLLDTDSYCKLFAFDIDIEKNSPESAQNKFVGTWLDTEGQVQFFDAREAWADRRHPARPQLKISLMLAAKALQSAIEEDWGIPTAVAYSGGKGVHVYGFTGLAPAADVRETALSIMRDSGEWEPTRGDNFWRQTDQTFGNGLRNLTIEVFPKQDSLDGKDLGNLMRMPLGRNLKNPKDPTFFIDMNQPSDVMMSLDPLVALA